MKDRSVPRGTLQRLKLAAEGACRVFHVEHPSQRNERTVDEHRSTPASFEVFHVDNLRNKQPFFHLLLGVPRGTWCTRGKTTEHGRVECSTWNIGVREGKIRISMTMGAHSRLAS